MIPCSDITIEPKTCSTRQRTDDFILKRAVEMLFLIQLNVIERFVNQAFFTKWVKTDVRFAGTQSTPKSHDRVHPAENSCASSMNIWTAQRRFRR